jgi:hypothetical protein
MSVASKTLSDFVTDFDLMKPDGTICFNATIIFSTEFKSIQLETEVQIVTFKMKQMSTIYLLHPDVVKHGIPDMIQDDLQSVTYVPGKCLLIRGVMLIYIDYILTIHPENSSCGPETLKELHAKQNN